MSLRSVSIAESLLLTLGIALLPVYIFSSGGVQPAHFVLAVFAIISLLKRGIKIEVWVFLMTGVSVYSFLIESFYIVLGAEGSAIINGVFFFYNTIVAVSVYSYCRSSGLSSLGRGLVVACAIAVISVGFNGVSLQEGVGFRSTGTFNNPNQLGYFSVCILSLTYLLYYHRHLKYPIAALMFSVALFLSIASLSKAAMLANFFVVILALKPVSIGGAWRRRTSTLIGPLIWFAAVSFAAVIIFYSYNSGAFDSLAFIQRLQGMAQESDSSLSSRGYFAFLEGNPTQILFGLGGDNVAYIVGHEVHSTLASMFNNYGVFGFTMFASSLAIWTSVIWRAYGFIGVCCLVGPAMLYGVTHNGTRFTIFWILFAASMAMASEINRLGRNNRI